MISSYMDDINLYAQILEDHDNDVVPLILLCYHGFCKDCKRGRRKDPMDIFIRTRIGWPLNMGVRCGM